jgi:hypothetical protein
MQNYSIGGQRFFRILRVQGQTKWRKEKTGGGNRGNMDTSSRTDVSELIFGM